MKKIKVVKNGIVIGEGVSEDGEDTAKALEMVTKAFKGVPGVKIEVSDGSVEEMVDRVRGTLSSTYRVAGAVKVGKYTAETTLEVEAVSEEEAIEKASAEGLLEAHIINNCYDDEYCDDCDDEYDDECDEDDEDEVDYDFCYHCSGHDVDCPNYTGGLCDHKLEAEK